MQQDVTLSPNKSCDRDEKGHNHVPENLPKDTLIGQQEKDDGLDHPCAERGSRARQKDIQRIEQPPSSDVFQTLSLQKQKEEQWPHRRQQKPS